jgi:hypothetical protein|tara:strand:- start:705 stop:914 length:210 start_codon:yes stop_codon:yes gene_type:complete
MSSSGTLITKGLIKYYEGLIALAEANVRIYMNQSVGIGEHADILEAVDGELEKIASAQDKIDVLENHFG